MKSIATFLHFLLIVLSMQVIEGSIDKRRGQAVGKLLNFNLLQKSDYHAQSQLLGKHTVRTRRGSHPKETQTRAEDRSFQKKKKCLELSLFPFPIGYFRCTVKPPKQAFEYWPYFEGAYLPDPANSNYFQDNYDSRNPPTQYTEPGYQDD